MRNLKSLFSVGGKSEENPILTLKKDKKEKIISPLALANSGNL